MRQVTEREEWVRYGREVTEEVVADAEARGVSGVAAVEQGKAHRGIDGYAHENDIRRLLMGNPRS